MSDVLSYSGCDKSNLHPAGAKVNDQTIKVKPSAVLVTTPEMGQKRATVKHDRSVMKGVGFVLD